METSLESERVDWVRRLDERVALFHAPRIRKLGKIGARIAYSAFVGRFAREPRRTTVPLFWGGSMVMVLPEGISSSVYRYGFFEADVSHMLLDVLRPGMTFFDVGAHFGYFTCLASKLVGSTGAVHSFEPTPSTFEILSVNAQARPNVRANNMAAYSSEKLISFEDFGLIDSAFNSAAGARFTEAERAAVASRARRYDVRAITVDAYVEQSGATPDFVKIDAENAEAEILRGMSRTLRTARPTISMEVGDVGKDAATGGSAQAVELLESLGYQAYEWRDGSLRPHRRNETYEYGNLLFRHGQ